MFSERRDTSDVTALTLKRKRARVVEEDHHAYSAAANLTQVNFILYVFSQFNALFKVACDVRAVRRFSARYFGAFLSSFFPPSAAKRQTCVN